MPQDRRRVYKMRPIVATLIDRGSFFEMGTMFGRPIITGLARIGGCPVAVMAGDPYHYAGAWSADACAKVVRFVDLAYLQTHSTNPLLKSETISRAIQLLLTNYPNCDSLFSVTRWQTRLYFQDRRAINHNPQELKQTQDLPPVYEENSCMYIFTRENLIAKRHRMSDHPLMFEIPRLEAVDIDEESDFQIADILKHRRSAQTTGK